MSVPPAALHTARTGGIGNYLLSQRICEIRGCGDDGRLVVFATSPVCSRAGPTQKPEAMARCVCHSLSGATRVARVARVYPHRGALIAAGALTVSRTKR